MAQLDVLLQVGSITIGIASMRRGHQALLGKWTAWIIIAAIAAIWCFKIFYNPAYD